MTLIIAARFQTFDAASSAAQRLMQAGVNESALHVFYVNPPGAHDNYVVGGDQANDPGTKGAPRKALGVASLMGAVGAVVGGIVVSVFADSFIPIIAGAGVGAYVGALAGAVSGMDKRRATVQQPVPATRKGEGRSEGVMLAVNMEGEREQDVVRILRESGGEAVERAQGRWRDGKWEDFDPLKPPVPQQHTGTVAGA